MERLLVRVHVSQRYFFVGNFCLLLCFQFFLSIKWLFMSWTKPYIRFLLLPSNTVHFLTFFIKFSITFPNGKSFFLLNWNIIFFKRKYLIIWYVKHYFKNVCVKFKTFQVTQCKHHLIKELFEINFDNCILSPWSLHVELIAWSTKVAGRDFHWIWKLIFKQNWIFFLSKCFYSFCNKEVDIK